MERRYICTDIIFWWNMEVKTYNLITIQYMNPMGNISPQMSAILGVDFPSNAPNLRESPWSNGLGCFEILPRISKKKVEKIRLKPQTRFWQNCSYSYLSWHDLKPMPCRQLRCVESEPSQQTSAASAALPACRCVQWKDVPPTACNPLVQPIQASSMPEDEVPTKHVAANFHQHYISYTS